MVRKILNQLHSFLKKRSKRSLALLCAAVLIGGLGIRFFHAQDGAAGKIVTDVVSVGSIQSTVTGYGVAAAREAVAMNPPESSKVLSLLVKEGDYVEAGTLLYSLDPTQAQKAVQEAQKEVSSALEGYQEAQKRVEETAETLQKLVDLRAELSVRAPFDGKLVEVVSLTPGSSVTNGQKIAVIASSGRLKMSVYYSEAYESDVYIGQSVQVSVPAIMNSITGKVSEIYKDVEYIGPEGGKCFEIVVTMNNPGTLTAGMDAAAVLKNAAGEDIYPYQNTKLDYAQTQEINAKVDGPLLENHMRNYSVVRARQALVVLGPEELEKQIEEKRTALTAAQESLETTKTALSSAQEKLEKAQNHEANMEVKAPISGTILSCSLIEGETADSSQSAIQIADTSVMKIEIQVDERNVGNVKAGMECTVAQSGGGGEKSFYTGTVESISLTGKSENGVSFFPAIVKVENGEGTMMTGMSVEYTLILAQSDNCLLVPAQAVQYTEQGNCLFVKTEKRPENAVDLGDSIEIPAGFYAVPVETGLSNSSQVEIKSGVEEETEIFIQKSTEFGSSFDDMYMGMG